MTAGGKERLWDMAEIIRTARGKDNEKARALSRSSSCTRSSMRRMYLPGRCDKTPSIHHRRASTSDDLRNAQQPAAIEYKERISMRGWQSMRSMSGVTAGSFVRAKRDEREGGKKAQGRKEGRKLGGRPVKLRTKLTLFDSATRIPSFPASLPIWTPHLCISNERQRPNTKWGGRYFDMAGSAAWRALLLRERAPLSAAPQS